MVDYCNDGGSARSVVRSGDIRRWKKADIMYVVLEPWLPIGGTLREAWLIFILGTRFGHMVEVYDDFDIARDELLAGGNDDV